MITPSWREESQDYSSPWQVFLTARPRRGECRSGGHSARVGWNHLPGTGTLLFIQPAHLLRTHATEVDILAIRICSGYTMACYGFTSDLSRRADVLDVHLLSVEWADCDCSREWAWAQWNRQAQLDQLVNSPAFSRPETKWAPIFRQRNNALHIVFREILADGSIRNSPQDPGMPCSSSGHVRKSGCVGNPCPSCRSRLPDPLLQGT
jgi:hypothetical protein